MTLGLRLSPPDGALQTRLRSLGMHRRRAKRAAPFMGLCVLRVQNRLREPWLRDDPSLGNPPSTIRRREPRQTIVDRRRCHGNEFPL